MVKQGGFTLIELVITLAILSVLLALAVPFTQRWSDDAQVQKGKGVIVHAYQQAKAHALRNPNGIQGASTAGFLLKDGQLLVCPGDPVACTSANARWQGALPAGVQVQADSNGDGSKEAISGATAWPLALDKLGLAGTSTEFIISKGRVSETITLQ